MQFHELNSNYFSSISCIRSKTINIFDIGTRPDFELFDFHLMNIIRLCLGYHFRINREWMKTYNYVQQMEWLYVDFVTMIEILAKEFWHSGMRGGFFNQSTVHSALNPIKYHEIKTRISTIDHSQMNKIRATPLLLNDFLYNSIWNWFMTGFIDI